MNPETIEQAREMLLQNKNEIETLRGQVTTLQGQITEKDATIEDLRNLNQRYYLQLAQGTEEPEEIRQEPEPMSLEDFAKTIKGVIHQ